MSTCFCLFKEKYIPIRDVLKFVKSFGGYVVNNEDEYENIPDDAIGIVEKDKAIIWVYYRSDLSEFKYGLDLFHREFGLDAETIITVEHGKDTETYQMVRNFYLEFMRTYPDTYLLGNNKKFYDYSQLSVFGFVKNGTWEFMGII